MVALKAQHLTQQATKQRLPICQQMLESEKTQPNTGLLKYAQTTTETASMGRQILMSMLVGCCLGLLS